MTPPRTSLRLNNDVTVDEFVALASAAEAAGFDQIWVSNDLYLRSAAVLLTAAAAVTERLALGVGIMNPYSVHPVEIAMMAGTLAEASGGRFVLGLGAGAEEFLEWAGIERPQPLPRTRAAVVRIRELLTGGREGTSPDYLRFDAHPVPIYIGAMGPKMLGMAGEVADGALPLLFPPEHYPTAKEQVVAGALAAGRDPSTIDVAACIWVSVDTDRHTAQRALAEKIAYYGASFSPYLLHRAGLSLDDFAPIQRALRTDGIEAATALVTPKMLRLGVAGTPDDVIARCAALIQSGATHVSFGPPLGANPLTAVQTLGSAVLPSVRQELRH